MEATALYRTIWRWHFYAGLLVMPLIVILAISGAIYLFKPQIDRWEERRFRGLAVERTVDPDAQVAAALLSFPRARVQSYRLPAERGDAALITLAFPGSDDEREVFVSPRGEVVGTIDPEDRIIAIVRQIHGQLLLGKRGSWIVELAASWAIVMILSGLYLWWPRGRRLAGVLWPRLGAGGRAFWRDLHAVTGFWVASLALVLLTTGLPWADVWGSAFKAVRTEMGWTKQAQDWTIGGQPAGGHSGHDHGAMARKSRVDGPAWIPGAGGARLSTIVEQARSENLAFPVLVTPPGSSQRFGTPGRNDWTVRSDNQNRPLRATIRYDAESGRELSREAFGDGHVIDRVIGYGIAWHEGQLIGWFNQLVGLLTAAMLVTLVISGFVMWRRRKPGALLGAPPLPGTRPRRALIAIPTVLALLLPLLAISMAILWLVERGILRRIPPASRWLGLTPA